MSNVDPLTLLDEAEALGLGPQRTARLRAALAAFDDDDLDALQGRAVALAMLAFDDPSELTRE
jgi:hypothetical protein